MKVQRLSELDGLRGIAALTVVFFHYFFHYNQVFGHDFHVPGWVSAGYYGVHLFFLVSGFVIFWTISRSEKPFDFLWSRFSRLYPVYWAAISVTFFMVLVFGLPGRGVTLYEFAANFLMFQEYFSIKHIDSVYWTLTLELSFYFWMFILFSFKQIKQIDKWLLVWIILASMLAYKGVDIEIGSLLKKFFLLEYIHLFAAGICFFKLWKKEENWLTYLVLASSACSLFVQYSVQTAAGLFFLYFIFYFAVNGKVALLACRPLVFFGAISYPLYLVHQNIGYVIIRKAYDHDVAPYIGIMTAIVVSFSLAIFLTFIVEKPALKYLRKLYKDSNGFQRNTQNLR